MRPESHWSGLAVAWQVFLVGRGRKAFYFSEICNITTSRKIASSNEQNNSNNNNNSVCVMKKNP